MSSSIFSVPSLGTIVIYTLALDDEIAINRRRTTGESIAKRIPRGEWPLGAQAHIGETVKAGQDYPAIITAVHDDEKCNMQVFLDGNDMFWATYRSIGPDPSKGKPGTWRL